MSKSLFEFHPWHCPVCVSSDEKFLGLRGGKSHRYQLGVEARIVQCKQCGLLYANPFPKPISLQEIYGDPDKYFAMEEDGSRLQRSREFMRKAILHLGKKNMKHLDVGSGRGEFVYAAKLEGADSIGTEVADSMIDYAKEKYKVLLQKESIEEHASHSKELYDFITMNAVLEHVYDPNSMIEAASRMLKSGGLLYIDVPNEPSLLTRIGNGINRLFGSNAVFNLSPTWSPYHVYGFNPRALKILLAKHGLEIESIKIWADPHLKHNGSLKDRMKAFIGTQFNRIANLTGAAGNLNLWARKL